MGDSERNQPPATTTSSSPGREVLFGAMSELLSGLAKGATGAVNQKLYGGTTGQNPSTSSIDPQSREARALMAEFMRSIQPAFTVGGLPVYQRANMRDLSGALGSLVHGQTTAAPPGTRETKSKSSDFLSREQSDAADRAAQLEEDRKRMQQLLEVQGLLGGYR